MFSIGGCQGAHIISSATRLRLFSGWVSSGAITVPGEKAMPNGMNMQSNAAGRDIAKTLGLRVLAGYLPARRAALVDPAMALKPE